MSGQMADVIVIDDEEFAIVDPEPGALFDPLAHGLRPVMTHTANMRGVLARYRIIDGRLCVSAVRCNGLKRFSASCTDGDRNGRHEHRARASPHHGSAGHGLILQLDTRRTHAL